VDCVFRLHSDRADQSIVRGTLRALKQVTHEAAKKKLPANLTPVVHHHRPTLIRR
jgi:hypothetical protein